MILPSSTRRGFLALLGVAPVAGPVVAKDAARLMKMSDATLPGTYPERPSVPRVVMDGPQVADFDAPKPATVRDKVMRLRKALASVDSPDNVKERMDRLHRHAHHLDADIAAMRSISPSAALYMQQTRVLAELREEQIRGIKMQLRNLLLYGSYYPDRVDTEAPEF